MQTAQSAAMRLARWTASRRSAAQAMRCFSSHDQQDEPSHEDLVPSSDPLAASGSTLGRGETPYRKGGDAARRPARGQRRSQMDIGSSDRAFQRWRSDEERYSNVEAPFSVAEPRLRLLYKEYLKMQDGSAAAAASGQEANEMPVNYCVCCYHGTEMLQPDNTTLLSQFVADNGTVLPKRLTKLCSKHQRAVASTIKQARALNFMPFHSKLHPKLRFTSVTPEASAERTDVQHKSSAYGGSRDGSAPADERA